MSNFSTYGYVRVSTVDQNVERQVVKMAELGIDECNVFIDKASGKDMDRPAWKELVNKLERGDTLIIDSLDRLGRNYDDVTKEWRRLTRECGVSVRCLDLEFFDSSKFAEMGDLGVCLEDMLLSLLSYVAQAERKKIKQRQREGIEIAKRDGKYHGRRPISIDGTTFSMVCEQEAQGLISAAEAARRLGISARTYGRRKQKVGVA